MPKFHLLPLVDPKELVARFCSERVSDALPKSPVSLIVDTNIQTGHMTGTGGSLYEVSQADAMSQFLDSIKTARGVYVVKIAAKLSLSPNRGLSLTYAVGASQAYAEIIIGDASGAESSPPHQFNPVPLVAALHEQFELVPLPRLMRNLLPDEYQHAMQLAETQSVTLQKEVARLAELITSQVEQNSQHLRELDAELREKTAVAEKKLREQIDVERAQVQRERTAAQRELGDAQQLLRDERAVFEKDKLDHDLRNNTVVRRHLFDSMKNDIIVAHQELGISEVTSRLRRPVQITCLVVVCVTAPLLASVIGWMLYQAMTDLSKLAALPWPLAMASVFLSLLLVSTLIFYLRWQNAWFREHADWETAKRRFAEDIHRASWVAELLFEWRRVHADGEKEAPVPAQFAAFTNDLFRRPNANSNCVKHPFDDLLALSRRFRKIKFDRSGMELEQRDETLTE